VVKKLPVLLTGIINLRQIKGKKFRKSKLKKNHDISQFNNLTYLLLGKQYPREDSIFHYVALIHNPKHNQDYKETEFSSKSNRKKHMFK